MQLLARQTNCFLETAEYIRNNDNKHKGCTMGYDMHRHRGKNDCNKQVIAIAQTAVRITAGVCCQELGKPKINTIPSVQKHSLD